jgi:hypothetical protein
LGYDACSLVKSADVMKERVAPSSGLKSKPRKSIVLLAALLNPEDGGNMFLHNVS